VNVSITPLTATLEPGLRAVQVHDDQVVFSGQPVEALDEPADDMDIHVICEGTDVVGMFRIDRRYHKDYPFADPATPGLRTFIIDRNRQGRGIAKACCAQMAGYLSATYPKMRAIYLTVNLRNPAARRVYLAGGFIDTGAQWPHGEAGPQNILRLDLV